MDNLDDVRKETILQEIIQGVRLQREQLPYEITIQEFAERAGISLITAGRKLNNLVREGKMTKRMLSNEHGRLVVYSVI